MARKSPPPPCAAAAEEVSSCNARFRLRPRVLPAAFIAHCPSEPLGQALFKWNYYRRGGGSGGVPQRGRLLKFDFPSAKFWVKIFFGVGGVSEPKDPPSPPSYKQSLVWAWAAGVGGSAGLAPGVCRAPIHSEGAGAGVHWCGPPVAGGHRERGHRDAVLQGDGGAEKYGKVMQMADGGGCAAQCRGSGGPPPERQLLWSLCHPPLWSGRGCRTQSTPGTEPQGLCFHFHSAPPPPRSNSAEKRGFGDQDKITPCLRPLSKIACLLCCVYSMLLVLRITRTQRSLSPPPRVTHEDVLDALLYFRFKDGRTGQWCFPWAVRAQRGADTM